MNIINNDLPSEGVKIGGILFKPREPREVSEEMGKELCNRKGFKIALPTKSNTTKRKSAGGDKS